jgi:membrane protease YdiL (CAAX protease family)
MTALGADTAAVDTLPGGDVGAPSWTDATVARTGIAVALVVTLLISRLPEIIARDILLLDVPWMAWATAALTALLWLASRTVAPLRPLERFLAVMILVTVLAAALPLALDSAVWAALVPASTQPIVALLATRLLYGVLGAVVLAWALLLGASRREIYARVGNLNAPTRSRSRDGGAVRWGRFGPIAFIGLMLLMAWFGAPMLPDRLDLAAAAPFIAIGALAALLNAFWEEASFRAAPLSMLQRAVGPGAGVLILALWFGLGHYYGGVPSGPMGLVATGGVAVLLGRAMIETRGFAWPLALHFAIDFVIFTFMAIASVA